MEEHTSGYPSENSADVHVEKTRLGYIHVDQIYGRCAVTEEYYARLMAVLTIPRLKEKELFMLDTTVCKNYRRNFIYWNTMFWIIKFERIHIWIGIFSFNIVNLLLNWSKSCFKCFKKIICRMEFILTEENFFINKWVIVTFGVFFFFLENVKFNVTWKTLQEEGSLTNSFNFNTKLEFIIIEI